MNPIRIHIGHHFFGSGNLGDDLMMAGFLAFVERAKIPVELTCCSMFDVAPMQRRFPQVHWLTNEPVQQSRAIAQSDVWLGLGDSPFQTVVGDWFLDHLDRQANLCRELEKPMYFLGVGVNDLAAVDRPQTQRICDYASHIWARDEMSARALRKIAAGKVTSGSDLAHLALRDYSPTIQHNSLAYLLNFEDPRVFDLAEISKAIALEARKQLWLVQEVRDLEGSERAILKMLPQEARTRLSLCLPDYPKSSIAQMLDAWRAPEVLLSSRYHGVMIGAWLGSRVAAVQRNDKVRGICEQFSIPGIDRLNDHRTIRSHIEKAVKVDRDALANLANTAEQNCREFFSAANQS